MESVRHLHFARGLFYKCFCKCRAAIISARPDESRRPFYQSSIGKKWIVALTGLVLIGYVIGHLIGNLQIFVSPAQINAYGAFLHSHVVPLWLVRIFLIICFVAHILTTIKLAIENRAARPERYAVVKREQASLAAAHDARERPDRFVLCDFSHPAFHVANDRSELQDA